MNENSKELPTENQPSIESEAASVNEANANETVAHLREKESDNNDETLASLDDDAFLYRNKPEGETKEAGPWSEEEKTKFIEIYRSNPPIDGKWGLFSKQIPGRVGYQCKNMYAQLVEQSLITPLQADIEKVEINEDIYGDVASSPISVAPDDKSDEDLARKTEQNEARSDISLMNITNVCRSQHWSPRMPAPWKLLEARGHKNKIVQFPKEDKTSEQEKFEYEAAKLMRLNVEHPLNFLLFSFPVPQDKKAEYINTLRSRLSENPKQPMFDKLVNEYFATIESCERIPSYRRQKIQAKFVEQVLSGNI